MRHSKLKIRSPIEIFAKYHTANEAHVKVIEACGNVCIDSVN